MYAYIIPLFAVIRIIITALQLKWAHNNSPMSSIFPQSFSLRIHQSDKTTHHRNVSGSEVYRQNFNNPCKNTESMILQPANPYRCVSQIIHI